MCAFDLERVSKIRILCSKFSILFQFKLNVKNPRFFCGQIKLFVFKQLISFKAFVVLNNVIY